MNNSTLLVGLALLAAGVTHAAEPPADPAKGKHVATMVCAACHGADGNSLIPVNPSLAGQHPEYLLKQLKDFKSGARKSPVMAPMTAPLSAEDMRNVAAHFAAQSPRLAGARDAALAEAGRALYRGGNLKAGVPACAGCHLPTGAGIPAQYPRLAGQPAE